MGRNVQQEARRTGWLNQRTLAIGVVVIVTIAIVALNLAGGGADGAMVAGADASDAALVQTGRQVYEAYCASCHGVNLEGQPNWQQELPAGGMPAPPHDETGHTWHHSDALLFEITKYGGRAVSPPGYQNNMPGFGDVLTDREIWAVLAYIKSTWPPEIQAAQQQVNEQAQ